MFKGLFGDMYQIPIGVPKNEHCLTGAFHAGNGWDHSRSFHIIPHV